MKGLTAAQGGDLVGGRPAEELVLRHDWNQGLKYPGGLV